MAVKLAGMVEAPVEEHSKSSLPHSAEPPILPAVDSHKTAPGDEESGSAQKAVCVRVLVAEAQGHRNGPYKS